jgi:antitoxin ParD1/3/4
MPTRNINLTPELSRFVSDRVRKGRYANASEVVRAGLRALQQDEAEDRAKVDALRAAVAEGMNGTPISGPEAMARLRRTLRKGALRKQRKELVA